VQAASGAPGARGPARRDRVLALLAGVLLFALGLAAWRFLVVPASESAAPDAPLSHADAPAAAWGSDARPAKGRDEAAPEAATEPSLVPPGDAPPRVSESRGELVQVAVLVRHEGNQEPVADCEFFYFENSAEREHQLDYFALRRGLDALELGRLGRRARTDAEGHATLACEPGKLVGVAVAPGFWGYGQVRVARPAGEKLPATLIVECVPAAYLRVQVVDAASTPQHGVVVRMEREDPAYFEFAMCSATTRGPDGIAELGPLEGPPATWKLFIDGAFPESEVVELDLRSPPAEPVRLVLPGHGQVEVRLAYPGGVPFAGGAGVDLGPLGGRSAHEGVDIGAGRVRFERVGLGLTLRAHVYVPGLWELNRDVEFAGPRNAGETVVCEVELDPAQPCLVGRAVDPDGRPLRFHDLELKLAFEGPVLHPELELTTSTDTAGRFAVSLAARTVSKVHTMLFVRDRSEERPLAAWRELDLGPRTNDVGTWKLLAPELLAGGTTVGLGGAAVGSRSVELVTPERRLGLGFALSCTSDEQGRFELLGWCTEPTVKILAGVRGARLRDPITVAKGRTDVPLRLAAAAQLRD